MKRLLSLLASLITLVAFANVAAASGAFGYQPELPNSLRK